MTTSRVLTAFGPVGESEFVAVVESSRDLELVRRCADLPDALAAAAAGLVDVAVVSGDLPGLDRDALDHLGAHGVGVVGAVVAGDERGERRLRQLGLTALVAVSDGPDEVAEVIEAARAELAAPQRPGSDAHLDRRAPAMGSAEGGRTADDVRRGRVVAVWGPTGAPGRTTVAVNVAAELAAAGRETLLVDADTFGASVGQLLSLLDEAPGLAAAARAAEQGVLDLPSLSRVAPRVAPHLRVLTGLPSAARWSELRAGALEQVLTLSRRLADWVVVDCGFGIEDDEELSYDTAAPRRNASTLVALAEADELLLVGAADPIGLQRLVRAVQDLGAVPSPTPRIVLNRARPSAVGGPPEQRIGQTLGRFAGLDDLRYVPLDVATLDAAVLAGRSLVEHAPASEVRRAVRALAQSLDPLEAGQGQPRRAARRGLGSAARATSATMEPWPTA